jgi:hypothetical protein
MTDIFVHHQNIEHFKRLAVAATDAPTRQLAQKLLNEELAKDAQPPPEGDDGRPPP